MTIYCPKINRVGIELEGAWHRDNTPKLKDDGSVKELSCDCEPRLSIKLGEKSSRPLLPVSKSIQTFVETNYPHHVNYSCGMHVHVSLLRDSDYARLAEVAFHEYFKTELKAWGTRADIKNEEFWKRLNGENDFCKDSFRAPGQMWLTSKNNRYTQLNYCYSVERRKCVTDGCPGRYQSYCRIHSPGKTLEIRVLPMFKQRSVAIRAIETVLIIISNYLAMPAAEFTESESIELNDSEIIELDNLDILCKDVNQEDIQTLRDDDIDNYYLLPDNDTETIYMDETGVRMPCLR